MASIIHITENIHIFCSRNFDISDIHDNDGEPFLLLSFIYNMFGERTADGDIIARSRHKFSECNPSCLRALIEENEPIPLDTMVDPDDAETFRESISNTITRMVCDCAGVEGLKMLQVVVLVEINLEEDFVYLELDEEELLHDRRINSLVKNIYKNSTMAEEKENENEVCAICLDEMSVGEEVACMPCIHRFHPICISRWFEKSGLCPLCRFNIDLF